MKIDDFEILVKKYDKEKNVVILNALYLKMLEIRGFTVRYTTTKYSPISPVWLVNPPSIKSRGGHYFWVIRFKDSSLWQKLEEKLKQAARDHANSL